MTLSPLIFWALAYAVGCLSTGYYLMRWYSRTDLRTVGSGSTGATNVARVLGTKGFVITFIGDFCRGVLVMWLAHWYHADPLVINGMFIAVVIGHIWPIQLHFQGGKGLAVMAGAIQLWDPRVALTGWLIFGLVTWICKRYKIAAVVAVLLLPIAAIVWQKSLADCLTMLSVIILIVIAHRDHLLKKYKRI